MIKFRDVLNSKGKQLVYLIYHLNQQRTWLLQEETWENDGRGRGKGRARGKYNGQNNFCKKIFGAFKKSENHKIKIPCYITHINVFNLVSCAQFDICVCRLASQILSCDNI